MRTPRTGVAASALGAAGLLMAGLVGVAPASQAAATVTVSGFVFRDLDNDGVRDPGEPGVPGVRVHRSTENNLPNAVTAADGSNTLTGVTPKSSGSIFQVLMELTVRRECGSLDPVALADWVKGAQLANQARNRVVRSPWITDGTEVVSVLLNGSMKSVPRGATELRADIDALTKANRDAVELLRAS